MSDGLGGGDAQLPTGGRARLADDDVDIAAERGEQAEQALERILAEVALQKPRHVGLGKAEQAPGLGLGDAALAHDGVDAADQLRLEQVGVGLGVAEVGEDVAPAAVRRSSRMWSWFYPPPCVFRKCCSATLSRRRTRSSSCFGVAIPRLGLLLEGVQDIDRGLEPDCTPP